MASPGVPYSVYGLAKPVLPPLHGNRNPGEVLIALAKGLGGSVQEALGFENMEAVVKQSAKAVFETQEGPAERYPGVGSRPGRFRLL